MDELKDTMNTTNGSQTVPEVNDSISELAKALGIDEEKFRALMAGSSVVPAVEEPAPAVKTVEPDPLVKSVEPEKVITNESEVSAGPALAKEPVAECIPEVEKEAIEPAPMSQAETNISAEEPLVEEVLEQTSEVEAAALFEPSTKTDDIPVTSVEELLGMNAPVADKTPAPVEPTIEMPKEEPVMQTAEPVVEKITAQPEADNKTAEIASPVTPIQPEPAPAPVAEENKPFVLSDIPPFSTYKYFDDEKNRQNSMSMDGKTEQEKLAAFEEFCLKVKDIMDLQDANEVKEDATLDRQRKALLGYPEEVAFYKNKVYEVIAQNGFSNTWIPPWYSDVTEAVYGEILGFSGISGWISGEKYKDSVSCKIIGDRIYYKNNGYLELQPQRISKARRDLLVRTLLLINPKESLSKPWHEVYTAAEHLRVTMYHDNGVTKAGEDVIIFRRYIMKKPSLEEMARRGTIPEKSIGIFQDLVKLGVNIVFTGPVESAKSTFMQAYQSLENPVLEACSVESDDETQYQEMMPTAPIIQFQPDDDNEDTVIVRMKRSDANYILVGEARNGKYLNLAVEAANMGTRRMKTTFHNTETVDFAYDVAEKITRDCGGSIVAFMIKVAKTFQYIVNMYSLPGERGKKRVKGVWEMRFDADDMQIYMHQICKYVPKTETEPEHWVWDNFVGPSMEEMAMEENPAVYRHFRALLQELQDESPNLGQTDFKNPYMDVFLKGDK